MWNRKGGADREAEALREAILGAEDALAVTGTRYYISNTGDDENAGTSPEAPWRTPEILAAKRDLLKPGDGVFFERGSFFRLKDEYTVFAAVACGSITVSDGVSYGAYGSGPKPVLCGSEMNRANPEFWRPSGEENIWVTEMPTSRFVGNIVFDWDKEVGWMKLKKEDVAKNLDYFFSTEERLLYLYLDKGNPGDMYSDIEVCIQKGIFTALMHAKNITIDNLCMKYTGSGGVEFNYGYHENISVTNCEIAWWGGTLMWDGSSGVRGGNAIGCYNDCRNFKVSHNWIYQGYDAAFSPQGDPGMTADRVEFSENLIEYCTWSYEQWVKGVDGQMSNTVIRDNIMRFAGFGWCEQRPDPDYNSHFNAWSYDLSGCISNYFIENNIFDCSSHALITWHWEKGDSVHEGFHVSGNTYYQCPGENNWAMWYGRGNSYYDRLQTADNQVELETAVAAFDSAPALVKWLG